MPKRLLLGHHMSQEFRGAGSGAVPVGRGVVVVPTAPERIRSRDSHYPYRPDSYFLYLTGFGEPDRAGDGGGRLRTILFCREKDPEREIWDGRRFGPEAAREAFGFDETHPSVPWKMVPKLLADQSAVYCPLGVDPVGMPGGGWINRVREQARTGVVAPAEIRDVRAVLDEMRLVKDERELGLMRQAAGIAAAAHVRAMRVARPVCASSRWRPNCYTSSAAAGPRGPPTRPSSLRAPMPASCTMWKTPLNSRRGPAPDRCRLRGGATPRTSPAPFP